MLHHAENATGFQRIEKGFEYQRIGFLQAPVMHIAKGQHHVRTARRCNRQIVRRPQRGKHRFAIQLGAPGVSGLVLFTPLALPVGEFGVFDRAVRQVKPAFVAQHWGNDFRIPAAAGPDFNHRHVRLQTEEQQRFARVAVLIARTIGFATMLAYDGFIEERFGGLGEGMRRVYGEQ